MQHMHITRPVRMSDELCRSRCIISLIRTFVHSSTVTRIENKNIMAKSVGSAGKRNVEMKPLASCALVCNSITNKSGHMPKLKYLNATKKTRN